MVSRKCCFGFVRGVKKKVVRVILHWLKSVQNE